MTFDPSELKGVFFDEAREHLGTMESALLALEQQPGDRELLNQIFRAAHSIKGGCGIFGFVDLLRFTHALEGLLHLVRDGEVVFDPVLADLLLRATDALGALVVSTQRDEPAPESLDALLAEIDQAARHEAQAPSPVDSPAALFGDTAIVLDDAAPAAAQLRPVRVVFVPGPDIFRQGMDPLLVVRDLVELGDDVEVTLDISALPDLQSLNPETCHLAWSITMRTGRSEAEVRDVFAFVEDTSRIELTWLDSPVVVRAERKAPTPIPPVSPAKPAFVEATGQVGPAQGPAKHAHSAERSSVRVDTAKIDRLIDLVGELVIAQSMVTVALNEAGTPGAEERLRDAVTAMDRNTKELQDRVMAVRMLPVGSVFNRFPRTVRDLSAALGKRVNLAITGEEIELDKGMVEKLADPLTHLVRNAIDHGLEPPEERRAAGKNEEGLVTISAVHQGGNVLIEVSDDGRGLPLDKIKSKARALGLLSKDIEPSIEDLHAVIFRSSAKVGKRDREAGARAGRGARSRDARHDPELRAP